jgi:hypothetical protein
LRQPELHRIIEPFSRITTSRFANAQQSLDRICVIRTKIAMRRKIVEHKADYLLALKGNNAEIEKGHGRIEMRTYTASSNTTGSSPPAVTPVSRASPTRRPSVRTHIQTMAESLAGLRHRHQRGSGQGSTSWPGFSAGVLSR